MKKITLLIIAFLFAINVSSALNARYKRIHEIDKGNRGWFGYNDVWSIYSHTVGDKYDYYNLFCYDPGLIGCRLQKMATPPKTNDPIINGLLEKYDDLITNIQNTLIEIAEEEAGKGNLNGIHTKKYSNDDLIRLNLLFVFYTKWDYINEFDGKQTIEFSIIEL